VIATPAKPQIVGATSSMSIGTADRRFAAILDPCLRRNNAAVPDRAPENLSGVWSPPSCQDKSYRSHDNASKWSGWVWPMEVVKIRSAPPTSGRLLTYRLRSRQAAETGLTAHMKRLTIGSIGRRAGIAGASEGAAVNQR
jgi:hypothetical protein